MDNDRYNETDSEASSRIEGDSDCSLDDDLFSETETEPDADDDIDCDADDSSVTDDEYDTGAEKTRTIVWRHVAFYIIPSPVKGRPNIPVAKLTLLHTKGEDRKPPECLRTVTFGKSHSAKSHSAIDSWRVCPSQITSKLTHQRHS